MNALNNRQAISHLGLHSKAEGRSDQDKCPCALDLAANPACTPLAHAYSSSSRHGDESQQVSIQSRFLTYFGSEFWHVLLWLGPITTPVGYNRQSVNSKTWRSSHGYGISLVTSSHLYRLLRLELAMYLKTNWKVSSVKFSIHWNLFWPRTVSWEAAIINHVLCGDVDAVKREFSTRRSTPFDQLPDGATLLHVC